MLWLPSILCNLNVVHPSPLPVRSKVSSRYYHWVKTHQSAEVGAFDDASYDLSLKVADVTYTVLYTRRHGEETVKYVSGRDLVVLVVKPQFSTQTS